MKSCPCGSDLEYGACCGMYHTKQAIPQTPEALMRSRYTAYTLGNALYIKETMKEKPLLGFDEAEAEKWAKSVVWLKLQIIKAYQNNDETGFVEFIASYLDGHFIKSIHELSEFKAIEGAWFYIDGKQFNEPNSKVSRNMPCPCGSGKKFKNCHALP
jgi:SEC-C motif-containing protein